MGTNGTNCTEWERDFDPATEQPYFSKTDMADFLKSHQEQVANLLAEIDRLRAENQSRAVPQGAPVAWSYELAHAVGTFGYSDWQKHLSETKPDVPAEAVRKLTPLYATSSLPRPVSGGENG